MLRDGEGEPVTKKQRNAQIRLDLRDAWARWKDMTDFELYEEARHRDPSRAVSHSKRDELLKVLSMSFVDRIDLD